MKNNTIIKELVINADTWAQAHLSEEIREEITNGAKNNLLNTIITCNYDEIQDGFLAWDNYKYSLINLSGEAIEQLKVIASVYETFHTNIIMNEEIPVDKHFYLCHTFYSALQGTINAHTNDCIDLVNDIEIEVTDNDTLVTELLRKNESFILTNKR